MTLRVLCGAVLAAFVAAGCGDSGPSKADFAKRANAICADLNRVLAPLEKEAAAAQRSSDETKVFADLARVTQRSADVSQPYLGKLDALETPPDDRDKLKAWIADGRRQLALLEDLGRAFAARDQTKIVAVSERVDALTTRANRFAASYGMRGCANDQRG
jgi:hypothetical protein